jgi:Big-like domain-containing protein
MRARRRPVALAALAAAIVLPAAPAVAAPAFSTTLLTLSGASPFDVFPMVATLPSGDSLVVWTQPGERPDGSVLELRRVRPDGTVSPPVAVSDDTQIVSQRDVVAGPGGRALVVWNESPTGASPLSLRARWVEPDGALEPQLTLRAAAAASSASQPAAAIEADGDAVVAWRNPASAPTAGAVEAREVTAAGTLGTLLQPPEGPDIGQPVALAAGSGGGALLVWRKPPGIVAMPIGVDGQAGTVATPVPAGVLTSPSLAPAGPGYRMVWIAQGPPAGSTALDLTTAGTAAGATRLVDPQGSFAGVGRLASDAAGRSIAFTDRLDATVSATPIGADGTPGTPSVVAPPAGQVDLLADGTVLGDGSAVTLWSRGVPGEQRTLVGRVGAGAPEALGSPADSVVVSTTPDGVGLVAWQEPAPGGATSTVRARQLLPPPVCADAAAAVVQGRPTTVRLACTGLQVGPPTVLSAPAHGTLGPLDPASSSVVYTPRPGYAGPDSFTFAATSPAGTADARTATIQVGRDSIAPRITRLAFSAPHLRLASAYRRPPARRPAFVLRFSEPSTVVVTLERKVRRRFHRVRTLRVRTPVRSVSLRLARKGLAVGAYRARIVATDLAGNRSGPRLVGFVVTRR